MRKLLLIALLSLGITGQASASTWWVPGHFDGNRWIGGHTRGQAGWLAPHENFNYNTGTWHFIPGHYTNALPRLTPAQHLLY